MTATAKRQRSWESYEGVQNGSRDKAASIGGLVAGLCNRSRQQQRDRDHDDDQRDEEQGLVRKWSGKGERHKPSYRSEAPKISRKLIFRHSCCCKPL
jgi:hypothetical protein